MPIHKVVWDGESIWAATTSNYECLGHPPALGLVRYQWEKQLLSMYYGREDGPCGFLIHDLLWKNGTLWVATELGLSRWDSKGDHWRHYLPNVDNAKDTASTSCAVVYKKMLDQVPDNKMWFDEPISYRRMLYNNIMKYASWFLDRYPSYREEGESKKVSE